MHVPFVVSLLLLARHSVQINASDDDVTATTGTTHQPTASSQSRRPLLDDVTLPSAAQVDASTSSCCRNDTTFNTSAATVTTQTTTQSTSAASTTHWRTKIALKWLVYAPPVLICMATIGNLMSIVVLQHPSFKRSSTSFILSALAFVDAGVVDTGLLRLWIYYAFDVDVRSFSPFSCKIHLVLTYSLHQISSWTLILLTAERFISVYFPFKCKELCSRRRVVAVWCAIVVVMFGFDSHFFVTFTTWEWRTSQPGPNGTETVTISYYCGLYDQYLWFIYGPWPWIDACLGDLLPFIAVFVGNVAIVVQITIASRRRALQTHASAIAPAGGKDAKGAAASKKAVTSTTVMLVVVSVTFLVLSLPSDIYFIGYNAGFFPLSTEEQQSIRVVVYVSITLLYYCNNSINFLMYFTSGRKFRLAAIDTVTCRRCRSGPSGGANTRQTMTGTTIGGRYTSPSGGKTEVVSMSAMTASVGAGI